ncbi:MAG: hypothetical protein ACRBDI_07900 [Alphaproteobacteria bacterium]
MVGVKKNTLLGVTFSVVSSVGMYLWNIDKNDDEGFENQPAHPRQVMKSQDLMHSQNINKDVQAIVENNPASSVSQELQSLIPETSESQLLYQQRLEDAFSIDYEQLVEQIKVEIINAPDFLEIYRIKSAYEENLQGLLGADPAIEALGAVINHHSDMLSVDTLQGLDVFAKHLGAYVWEQKDQWVKIMETPSIYDSVVKAVFLDYPDLEHEIEERYGSNSDNKNSRVISFLLRCDEVELANYNETLENLYEARNQIQVLENGIHEILRHRPSYDPTENPHLNPEYNIMEFIN